MHKTLVILQTQRIKKYCRKTVNQIRKKTQQIHRQKQLGGKKDEDDMEEKEEQDEEEEQEKEK